MRILMVSPVVGEAFGQERVMKTSTELLRAGGHAVYYLAADQKGILPANDGTETISHLNQLNWITPRKKIARTHKTIERFLKDVRPDMVHFIDQFDHRTMNYFSDRYPCVMTSHTVATSCPNSTRTIPYESTCTKRSGWPCLWHSRKYGCLTSFGNLLKQSHVLTEFKLRQSALRKFAFLFAISRFVQKSLIGEGFPELMTPLVPNPISLKPPNTTCGVPNLPLIVCASRLEPHKGIDQLILAISKIKSHPWVLWICGMGSQQTALKKLVTDKNLSDRVRFLGKVPYSETQKILAAAQVVVQPNRGPEPFGLTVAEATALGIPTVVPNLPALNEIIRHEKNGLIFETNNLPALSKSITRALTDATLRRECKTKGPLYIKQNYSLQNHIDLTLTYYKKGIEKFNQLKQATVHNKRQRAYVDQN